MDVIEEYKKQLKDSGMHHASKEFKEAVEKKKAELSNQPQQTTQPQKTEKNEEKMSVLQKKSHQTELEIDVTKSYTFKMVDPNPPKFWVVPKLSRVFDNEEKRYRQIRYNKLAESPFVDEQDESLDVDVAFIRFVNGELTVSGRDAILIKYLINLPEFKPNNQLGYSKYLFDLDDKDLKIKEKADFDDKVTDAKVIIKECAEKDPRLLADFVRSRFNYAPLEFNIDAIKLHANACAEQFPHDFINDLNNPIHRVKGSVARGLGKVFDVVGGTVKSLKTGNTVYTFDANKRWDDEITSWILKESQPAKDFYSELVNGLD